jgi:hypothetical protein
MRRLDRALNVLRDHVSAVYGLPRPPSLSLSLSLFYTLHLTAGNVHASMYTPHKRERLSAFLLFDAVYIG